MGKVNESIFSGQNAIIPMADVQHIEKHWFQSDKRTSSNYRGIIIITKHTKWNAEIDYWENPIYLSREEGDDFIKAWTYYRYELEGNI